MTRSGSNGDHGSAGTATVVGAPVAHRDRGDRAVAGTVDVGESRIEAPSHDEPQAPYSDFPTPAVLSNPELFYWVEDAPAVENYVTLGQRLGRSGDLFRIPQHGSGLLLASDSPNIPPKEIVQAKHLAPVIADRLVVRVIKGDKPKASQIPAAHLNTMLGAEVFLQQFPPLDAVVKVPMYLANFELTRPGYNNAGPGEHVLYVGEEPESSMGLEAINRFLDVMDFASNADRTNTVAAALTVMLRNLWLGAKPLIYVTSTKSHGGKDTVIDFACGRTLHLSISYEKTDWALQKNFCDLVQGNPEVGVVVIENVRLDDGRRTAAQDYIRSPFLERFLTDPNPVLRSTGTGDPRPRKNDLVLAMSTNHGRVDDDHMNRALPIGNPKFEYLPTNRSRIEAELRGMIERWKGEGRPLDDTVRHPCNIWAATIGGVLRVSGFKDFLANYTQCVTEDDPVRHALGLLGAARRDTWLQSKDWETMVSDLGLVKRLVPEADRDSREGRQRGIGLVLSAHRDETFHVETEDERLTLRLEKRRRRFNPGGQPSTRYRFRILERQVLPEDPEGEEG